MTRGVPQQSPVGSPGHFHSTTDLERFTTAAQGLEVMGATRSHSVFGRASTAPQDTALCVSAVPCPPHSAALCHFHIFLTKSTLWALDAGAEQRGLGGQ